MLGPYRSRLLALAGRSALRATYEPTRSLAAQRLRTLRFLLADDPGAGKTIMAGLLIKALLVHGGLQRCLVVCPRSLAKQSQDELYRRFQLPFDILTNDKSAGQTRKSPACRQR